MPERFVRWNDRPLSHIIFFMVIPTAASAFYVKLLAGLSQTFMKDKSRDAVMAEENPEKLWKILVCVTRSTVK